MLSNNDSVVVTGLGATTPLGGNVKATWSALLNGQSGVHQLTDDWAAKLPVRIGARVAAEPSGLLSRLECRRLDRSTQFSTIALREAWADAGFTGPAVSGGTPDSNRVGIVIGTGIGGVITLLDNYDIMLTRGPRSISAIGLPMLMPNNPAAQASIDLAARAMVRAPTGACAAGAEAIAQAVDMIQLGRADVVVAGGTEAIIHPLTMAAFAQMRAVSRNNEAPMSASRPYDRGRDGFVLAEGAAVLILESKRHAEARGARIYCAVGAAGTGADAYHIAHPSPDGEGMARAMRAALRDADLLPADVAHVSAHATSTPQGDVAESKAIRMVLGGDGYAVSAIKSMTGHLIGASGALAAVVGVLTLCNRLAPPTINIDHLDKEIELDVVRDTPRGLRDGQVAVMINSAGFGGQNVALALKA